MGKSKVYFTDMRTGTSANLPKKLETLMKKAGIGDIDFQNKFVAIKTHFGELGNLAYLRPNYARTVAETVKSLGGRPFLTDCNTLYVGSRKNALEHIEAAYINGFSPFSTGCHIIIGDGLKGTDDVEVPVEGGEYVKCAKIGRAIMDADILISLSHFKGHEAAGFGGALKNLGMGCGSRAGKMEMHCDGKPHVNPKRCVGCGMCAKICAQNAITLIDKKASIDHEKCAGCGRCIGVCHQDAVVPPYDESNDIMNRKIAEYAKAVTTGRPCFHISLVVDVSPFCDCHAENDAPIVPDVGMFASFDPVALDKACVDAVNAQPVIADSLLGEAEARHEDSDYFHAVSPDTNWRSCLEHAEKIGLGAMEYELVTVK